MRKTPTGLIENQRIGFDRQYETKAHELWTTSCYQMSMSQRWFDITAIKKTSIVFLHHHTKKGSFLFFAKKSSDRKMLLKRPAKNKIYDVLHHGTVYVCMGVSVLSMGYMGWFGYRYFTHIKPQRELEQLNKIKSGQIGDMTKTLAT